MSQQMLRALVAAFSVTAQIKIGLYLGGWTGAASAVVDKYKYSDDSRTAGTSISTAVSGNVGFGNATQGYSSCGTTNETDANKTAATRKYTYATDGESAGGSMGTARWRSCASCNNTIGIVSGGQSSTNITTITHYQYSSDTASGTAYSLGTARQNLFAMGVDTKGFHCGGVTTVPVTNVDKLVYGTETRSAGNALGTTRGSSAAAANTTTGYVWGGQSTGAFTLINTVEKIDMSAETWSAATALTTTGTRLGQVAANGTLAVLGIGFTGAATATTVKYPWATEDDAAGTNLATARYFGAATSSEPGHF